MSILEINQLTRKFGTLTAVDGINLRVEEGQIFGLLGPASRAYPHVVV